MSVGSMVQVKTRTIGRDQGWHFAEKHEKLVHPRLFYALLDLEPPVPAIFILPSSVVADVVTRSHRTWLATPSVSGRPHRDNPVRRVRPDYGSLIPNLPPTWLEDYRDRWDYLTAEPDPA